MAFLFITEYARTGQSTRNGGVPVGEDPPLAEQVVVNTGASTQSVALNVNTTMVRLHADSICSVAFGASPTATITNRRMAAGSTEYFGIDQSSPAAKKYAVVLNT